MYSGVGDCALRNRVSPFRHFRITGCLPPPRNFSQATTSFISSSLPSHPPYALTCFVHPVIQVEDLVHNLFCREARESSRGCTIYQIKRSNFYSLRYKLQVQCYALHIKQLNVLCSILTRYQFFWRKNDSVCIFQYSVVKIALGRELLLAAKERSLNFRLLSLVVVPRTLRGDKKELGGVPSSVSVRSVVLAIRGLVWPREFERLEAFVTVVLQRSLSPISRG